MKNLDTVFPFYDALTEQTRFRPGMDTVPFIIIPNDRMVPFVISREHSAGTVNDIVIRIIPCDGGDTIEMTGNDLGIVISQGPVYDDIYCVGHSFPSTIDESAQGYYMEVEDGYPQTPKIWYSETFGIRTSLSGYLYLEFKTDYRLSRILPYFIQAMYIDQKLNYPEYTREDTGDTRDGVMVREKQVRTKADVLSFDIIPEYLADALTLLPMMDLVQLTTSDGQVKVYIAVTIKDPEPIKESYGLFAGLEVHLISGVVIKKLNFIEAGYYTHMSNVYGGTVSMGIIKADGPFISTINVDGEYEYEVIFDTPMPDANYTPVAFCQEITTGAKQDHEISDITANGFLITTLVACEIRWSALHS